MPMYRKLTTAAAVAALAFGLAACGGGGSDEPTATAPPPTTTPDPMPPAPTPVAVTVPDAMYLDAANAPMAGSMTIMAGMTGTSGGVTFLCAAGGEDCEVTVADDGSVTATGGMVTASLTADAMEQVADAKQMKADEDADMAQMARDRAIGQASAMASPGTAPAIVSISHPAGKAVSVRVTGFKPTEMQPAMLGNFAGVSLSDTSSAAATQYMTVYTDIAEPKRREFYNFDADSDTPPAYSLAITGGVVPPLPLSATPPTDTASGHFNAGNIDLTIFPTKGPSTGGTVTKTFEANARADGAAITAGSPADQVKLPGTFDGARGTYRCTGADCTVQVTPAGAYSFAGAGTAWTFTPNNGEKAYHEDAEFVRFGWWMSEPARSTGTYQFATLQDGVDHAVTDGAAGVAVTGDATYTGNAAGRYSIGDDAGAFTANASLTAKFGNATAAGSISGMISGFQGDADMSGWSVELKKINLPATGLTNDATSGNAFATTNEDQSSATYNGTIATLGDTMAHGTWSGSFYGNEKNPDMPGQNAVNAAPLAVGGQFNASGASAIISGAFGARR